MQKFKFLISAILLFFLAFSAAAQDEIPRPDFTASSISKTLESLEARADLSEDQQIQIRRFLETASAALTSADQNNESETLYRDELENASKTLKSLSDDIAEQQAIPDLGADTSEEPMREEALAQLELQLVENESRASSLRSELEGYQTGLQILAARQVSAPNELAEARQSFGEIPVQLVELGDGEAELATDARRKSLLARQYMLAARIGALEREIAGTSKRGEILTARKNLVELKLEKIEAQIKYLQEKTGQRRTNEAAQAKSEALTTLALYAESHVLVQELARSNVSLSDSLIELASNATSTSKQGAAVRSRLDDVESDLRVARDFIGLGNLNRQAGATLRRLSNQLQPPQAIKNQIDDTQKSLIDLTQNRLIAQDTLRGLPLGSPDIPEALSAARVEDPGMQDLGVSDEASYRTLYTQHRDMLLRVANASSTRINEIVELQTQQKELLTSTVELKDLLDEKLLWVPSVPEVNTAWPRKVIRGAALLFSPEHIRLVSHEFVKQSRTLWPLLFLFTILIVTAFFMRKRLWVDIHNRAKMVGDVSQDSFWHTPIVVILCVLIALPFPLLFLLFAVLFGTSSSADPLIPDIAETFLYLTFLSLFFLSWRAWDKDKSLFVAHYKLPEVMRERLENNFRWFIPLGGLATALVGLTSDNPRAEIYEGFSLFAFLISALAISIFSYRIIFLPKKDGFNPDALNSYFRRYRWVLALIFIGVPLWTICFAMTGYYDTSHKILWRVFVSGWLLLLTYVVYGFIRRAVLVAQRRLALRQAIETRDAAILARQEKAAAEERGEALPALPPVDTSKIDIKAISRQSSQLLNTLIVLGFAGLIWMIWADLLPALSVFNDFVLGSYTGEIIDESGAVMNTKIPITLWNLIQSVVIFILTCIAAKNLPGFLEVFVLTRSSVNAGTRYAIRTILGYVIIALGVVIAFDRLGLQWSQLRWIVTGLSVGIGFGLQKIIANFISGLIILFERPIRLGDYVTIGEQSGTVSRIQIRATTLSDLDNREILIPNEALISERVTNWTLSNSVTRMILPVGIAYGSDTDKARDIMLAVLKANPKVLNTPAPNVLFTGFGDSSLDFQMRVFLNNFEDRWPVTHVIHTEINKALEAEGISIPFPQTDVNIIAQDMPKPKSKK